MKSEKFEGTVEAYQGVNLKEPLKFSGEAPQYETVAEAQASEDWPGPSEVLKMVNAKKLTAAKAKAYQDTTKPLKEAYEKSDDYKRKNLIDAAMAANFSKEEAEALAESKIPRK